MQIAIDYTPAVAQAAGIGRYARDLVAALAQVDGGNRYTLFSACDIMPGNPVVQALPLAGNVDLRVVPVGERWLTRVWHRLRLPLPAELLTGPAQIFHALDFALPPTRMRRVVTIHDLAFLTHPQYALPKLASFLGRVVPRAARAADAIITVSEHTRRVLLRRMPELRPERVFTVPLGVSAHFAPCTDFSRQQALAERLGLVAPFVLSVGTLEPRKNYPTLMRAFAEARRMPGGPRQLVIAGRHGWRSESIFTLADELGLHNSVIFADGLSDADLVTLYSMARVVAQVSHTEGFGLPLLEAMACGAPVVASDGGALPEVAGDAALIVPASDAHAIAHALHRVTTDLALHHHLRAHGFERASHFTWQSAAQKTLAVYSQVA